MLITIHHFKYDTIPSKVPERIKNSLNLSELGHSSDDEDKRIRFRQKSKHGEWSRKYTLEDPELLAKKLN